MAPPRRRGAWGSVESIVDDLLLVRDAGGLELAGADRLQATLRLRGSTDGVRDTDIVACRQLLAQHLRQAAAAYRAVHRGDPVANAAADALEAILLQAADATRTAAAIRREALQRHHCQLQPDSLRKRETAVIWAVAESIHAALSRPHSDDEPVTALQLLNLLKPFAELADTAVTNAVELLTKRAALRDEALVDSGLAHAIWAVAQLGVLPVYALDRLEQLGQTDLAHSMLGYTLHAMITVPFQREPRDMDQLATAIQPGEDPVGFYQRLLRTPVMRPVVQRFAEWLGSHDTQTCQVNSNDVMIGYCSPHYYGAICEGFVDMAGNWATGGFQRDVEADHAALTAAARRPPAKRRRP